MDTNADYETLRKLYYGTQFNKMPFHTKMNYNQSLTSSLSEDDYEPSITKETEMSPDEGAFLTSKDDELDVFQQELSQRSFDVIASLYQKYGTSMYGRIDEMIRTEDFSEWEELEKHLMEENIQSILPEALTNESELLNLYAESELLLSSVDTPLEQDEDFAYLDALVSKDYRRMNTLNQEEESLTSIFSEILENETQSTHNYEDDVFNENIALIYNEEVDLDNSEWSSIKKTCQLGLDETIEQLKDEVSLSQVMQAKPLQHELNQSDLDVFYAQDRHVASASQPQQTSVETKPLSIFRRFVNKFKGE